MPLRTQDTDGGDISLSSKQGPDHWTLFESMDGSELCLLLDRDVHVREGVCHDHDTEAHCDPMRRQEGAPTKSFPGRRLGLSLLLCELDPGHGKLVFVVFLFSFFFHPEGSTEGGAPAFHDMDVLTWPMDKGGDQKKKGQRLHKRKMISSGAHGRRFYFTGDVGAAKRQDDVGAQQGAMDILNSFCSTAEELDETCLEGKSKQEWTNGQPTTHIHPETHTMHTFTDACSSIYL
ncbi:hypothetical protein BC939DRAFT_285204 [Gamsiella multidivaricata]|uniref:uncharacterized protein n=1 Tax=Gamsiella multidivaricata TaxID=101098 RepID=UPI0022206526|nr:uncharacterized protein BC939DRAFT_285204 [Gamsiella multidivaricata]KAI7830528.1 hypothetical protein BC939DRAFT_285204 [Gamsiella multidivaricata]